LLKKLKINYGIICFLDILLIFSNLIGLFTNLNCLFTNLIELLMNLIEKNCDCLLTTMSKRASEKAKKIFITNMLSKMVDSNHTAFDMHLKEYM